LGLKWPRQERGKRVLPSPDGNGDLAKAVTGAHMSQLVESEFEDSDGDEWGRGRSKERTTGLNGNEATDTGAARR
jgi:hypothetical protein